MNAATEHSQRSTIEIEQHVRQLNDEWVKAMVRADAATLERIMADDFYFTYPLEGDDKAQFIADVTSGDLKIQHITREQLNVRVFGTTGCRCAEVVVARHFRTVFARIALIRMRRATRCSPIRWPWA